MIHKKTLLNRTDNCPMPKTTGIGSHFGTLRQITVFWTTEPPTWFLS